MYSFICLSFLLILNSSYSVIYSAQFPTNDDLIDAANEGDFDRVKELLEANAKQEYVIAINAVSGNGVTALHFAVWHDYYDIVTLLLSYDADPNIIENMDGCAPLHWAIENYSPNSAIVLIRHSKTNLMLQDIRGQVPMQVVCLQLDELQADIESLNLRLRELQAEENNPNAGQIHNVREEIDDNLKRINNCKKIIRELVFHKVFVYRVMDWLEDVGSEHSLDYLDKQYRLLIYRPKVKDAIYHGYYGLVLYYATKVSLEMFDEKGNNPLHWAVEAEDLDIIKLILLIRPSLIQLKNKYNETPVQHAIFYNSWDALAMLCKIATDGKIS